MQNQIELTEEQKQQIEANRLKAQERLAQKRKTNDTQPRQRKRTMHYVDYDLSTLKDTKGGFLIADDPAEKRRREREEALIAARKRVVEPLRKSYEKSATRYIVFTYIYIYSC
jgi:hypothetical protein